MAVNVDFSSLLAFEAAHMQVTHVPQPLQRYGTGLEVERLSRSGVTPGVMGDFSGGLVTSPGVLNWQQNYNRFRYNQGVQLRYPGVAVLPYVLSNQGSIAALTFESYWKLDEASGNATDSDGGGNTLTDTNTVTAGTGKIAGSRHFTRANSERLTIADNASVSLGSGVAFSIGGWVKFDTLGNRMDFCGKLGGAASEFTMFMETNSTFQVQLWSATGGTQRFLSGSSFGAAATGTWYHVVVTHDGVNTATLYINGTAITTATNVTDGVQDSTGAFQLGAANSTNHLDGDLDEWFFKKSGYLTAAQVSYIYNAGSGRSYEDLTGEDADISSHNTNGVRAHGIVSTAGGTRLLTGLGTKLYRANTTTGAQEIAPFTVDGGSATDDFGGNVTCVAQGPVAGTQSLLVALAGSNDILYTTDVTDPTIAFTTLKATASGDWIAAMQYMPTAGPGAWAIIGTLDGVSGVFSELGSTPAASWNPVLSSLTDFVDQLPSSPVMFTAATAPSGVVNDATNGDVAWTNASNAAASDDSRATVDLTAGQTSQWLRASFDLTALVPATNQVVGLLPRVERRENVVGTPADDYEIQIRVAGTQVGVSRYPRTIIDGATDVTQGFGAFDDPWFTDLYGADLADIEVWYRALCFSAGAGNEVEVDYMSLAAAYRPVPISRVIKTSRSPFDVRASDLAITPSVRFATPREGLIVDGSYATFSSGGADQTSDYLIYGPFFAEGELPASALFSDIQVDIYRGQNNAAANTEDLVVQLFMDGSLIGFNNAVLATEWNGGLTTISPRSYGPRWGIDPLTGAQMSRLYVAVRVLGDANVSQIDGMTMHVGGFLPGQTTSFDGAGLGGIGSSGSGSVVNGWMVARNPTTPNRVTIVTGGELWFIDCTWDADAARIAYSFSQPNEGMPYVHHAAPYLGGYMVTGGNSIGPGNLVKVITPGGDVLDYAFPQYHGSKNVVVNSIMVQGAWAILDVVNSDNTDRQWWFHIDKKYYPDTILQSLSENEAGSGLSSIAATPIAWSTQPVYGSLNYIYSVFPNSTDTAWARQKCPSDLGSDPRVTNTTWTKTMAFNSSGVENTALYFETPQWDIGPTEANKTMLTLQYLGRWADDNTSYGSIVVSLATDGGTSFTAVGPVGDTSFNSAFEKKNIGTPGTAYKTVVWRFSLSHEAGSTETPDALPFVFETDQQWPNLRNFRFWIDPARFTSQNTDLIEFFKNVTSTLNTKSVGTLKVSTVRDNTNTGATMGAVATLSPQIEWGFRPKVPELGTPLGADHMEAPDNVRYMILTFDERPGAVA